MDPSPDHPFEWLGDDSVTYTLDLVDEREERVMNVMRTWKTISHSQVPLSPYVIHPISVAWSRFVLYECKTD